ncbi:MAG: hypothetical protein AAF328_04680 [Planctomycetota bacterium]
MTAADGFFGSTGASVVNRNDGVPVDGKPDDAESGESSDVVCVRLLAGRAQGSGDAPG